MAKNKAKMNKFLTGAITATMVASAVAPVAALADETETSKFTDITNYDQATQDKVNALAAQGIFTGTSDTTFEPGKAITRGQVVKLLGRYLVNTGIAEVPANWETEQRFTDLPVTFTDKDLLKNAAVVYDAGVFKGNNGNLNSAGTITRENMALVLDRAAAAITGTSLVQAATGKEDSVADLDKAKAEAQSAIKALNALNISTVDNFNPKGNVQRVHFATFLYNAIEVIDAIEVEDEEKSEITIVSAEARSNTEVTVVLGEAPLKQLKASDFNITPNLSIVSVTTNNNIATIKTTSQSEGTSYTITPAVGSGTATFTGLAAVSTEGAIEKTEVTNLRQILITFKQDIHKDTINLNNTFLGLTENDEEVELEHHSLHELLTDESDWEIVPLNPIPGEVYYKEYVLQSTNGDTLLEAGPEALEYNTNGTIEVRNAKDRSGGYINTSQGAYTVADKKAPVVSVDGLVSIKVGETPKLKIEFDEPVLDTADNPDFKVYINGILVSDTSIYTDVNKNLRPNDQKVASLDLSDYEKDVEHTITVVGAKDLNNNVIANNKYEKKFIIKEARDTIEFKAPVVKEVKQIADNVFSVEFDQVVRTLTEELNDGTKEVLNIKNGLWDGSKWIDLKFESDTNGDITATSGASTFKVEQIDIPETVLKPAHTVWFVELDAELNKANNNTFSYDGQNFVIRDVNVDNVVPKDVGALANYLKGDRYVETFTFQRDIYSPAKGNVGYDIAAGKLYVGLKDAPFNGIINLVSTEGIKVSKTSRNSTTKDYIFDSTTNTNIQVGAVNLPAFGLEAGKYLEIDLANEANASDLLSDGQLIRNDVYTVTLPGHAVEDANQTPVPLTTAINEQTVGVQNKNNSPLEFSITVGAGSQAEGAVPQTTKYLITSGQEIKANTTTLPLLNGTEVGRSGYMTADENLSKLLVIFEGEVNQASAVNKRNYTFNGAPLTAGTTVTFYEEDILGDSTKEKFVIIDLENGTVERDGAYTFSVSGVTNNKGKVMLPVHDSIALTDNTSPVAQSIAVRGSRQIEVKFNEAIDTITDEGKAGKNFKVTINGAEYLVTTATNATDPSKVILTLVQDLDLAKARITVTTQADENGDVFVTDTATKKNKIKTGVRLSK